MHKLHDLIVSSSDDSEDDEFSEKQTALRNNLSNNMRVYSTENFEQLIEQMPTTRTTRSRSWQQDRLSSSSRPTIHTRRYSSLPRYLPKIHSNSAMRKTSLTNKRVQFSDINLSIAKVINFEEGKNVSSSSSSNHSIHSSCRQELVHCIRNSKPAINNYSCDSIKCSIYGHDHFRNKMFNVSDIVNEKYRPSITWTSYSTRLNNYDLTSRINSHEHFPRTSNYERATMTSSHERATQINNSYERVSRTNSYECAIRTKNYERAIRTSSNERAKETSYERAIKTTSNAFAKKTASNQRTTEIELTQPTRNIYVNHYRDNQFSLPTTSDNLTTNYEYNRQLNTKYQSRLPLDCTSRSSYAEYNSTFSTSPALTIQTKPFSSSRLHSTKTTSQIAAAFPDVNILHTNINDGHSKEYIKSYSLQSLVRYQF